MAEEDHVLGVPFALWTKQIATRLIPNLTTRGAVSTLLGAVSVLALALLAASLPARRASRVDPIVAHSQALTRSATTSIRR